MSRALIDSEQLMTSRHAVRLFDVRWRLGQPDYGKKAHARAHIPGAVFVDLDQDLSAPPDGARHPLPEPSVFARTLGRLGLTPEKSVVAYDDTSGTVAARMWWMLQAIGHTDVRILDGGIQAWEAAGGVVEADPVAPEPAHYPEPAKFSGSVGIDGLAGRNVLDVRGHDRYTGAVEPVDPRAGHIPGAVNIPATESLGDGRFLPPDQIARIYSGIEEPAVSCGSGVVACHTAAAFAIAGLPIPEVYVGSFSEWSNSDRPVHTGEAP
ncbi:MAG: sulfurtransferase [Acidimicrobiia bacterium]|nr:sulfurtransferase [Acidimicrobiia bacterium]